MMEHLIVYHDNDDTIDILSTSYTVEGIEMKTIVRATIKYEISSISIDYLPSLSIERIQNMILIILLISIDNI